MKKKTLTLSPRNQVVAQALKLRVKELAIANRKYTRESTLRVKAVHALTASREDYANLLKSSRMMREQLKHLSRQLLLAQEDERKKISRELHDEIAQMLSSINVHLAGLFNQATIDAKVLKRKITLTQRLVEKSVKIVHRFASQLRPVIIDDLGLIPALQSFIKDFIKDTQIKIDFTAFTGVEKLNSTKRIVLYRVVQEALANVSQHAHATEVMIKISKLENAIHMDIHDNGQSFDVERMLFSNKRNRLGLLGMRERVEMIGGDFRIESSPSKGTRVIVEIPTHSTSRSV